ncbi:hypothetical protein GCM10009619_20290 [Williamsia maris]
MKAAIPAANSAIVALRNGTDPAWWPVGARAPFPVAWYVEAVAVISPLSLANDATRGLRCEMNGLCNVYALIA